MDFSAVILILALLGVAVLAPRLRVSRLVPITCILLGFFLGRFGIGIVAHGVWDFVESVLTFLPVRVEKQA
ncbi:hypothetical protein [Parafrankia discariae]|uniref:hypothetical protein n=1 Tax=Parafrankia discariae TaxID=365528 RepID=UPI00038075F7|nr:hypothetical protein [Parafrankia discariae]